MIRDKKKQAKISFNAWLIKCISKAVEECRAIHGVRKGKRKIVIFEDVDISIMIEREVQGEKVPLPYVIRKTNEKSISEIYNEIRMGQGQAINVSNFGFRGKEKRNFNEIYYSMPGLLEK